jgi:hypothetical protein
MTDLITLNRDQLAALLAHHADVLAAQLRGKPARDGWITAEQLDAHAAALTATEETPTVAELLDSMLTFPIEQPAVEPSDQPRLFHLQRDHDVSGVSGTGRVANGVLWPDGTVSLRWIGERPSTVHWDRLEDAEHGGATRIVWADEQPPVDRAAVLREAIDVAREEGHRLEVGDHDARAARGARSVAYLLRQLLAKAQPAAELQQT